MEVMHVRDPVRPLRDWLQANFTAAAGRVYKGAPAGVTTPYITMRRVGGSPSRDTPEDQPLIQFDVRGAKGTDAIVETLAYALADFLRNVPARTAISGSMNCMATWIMLGPIELPDPSIDKPRYIVDCRFAIVTTA